MLKKTLIALLVLSLASSGAFAVFVYRARHSEDMAFLNEIRYELGEHRGAETCATCHEEIYRQWRDNSRHAVSTTAESVLHVQRELGRHRILNYILGGEEMCYACHGPEAANAGVDCETCHGVAPQDMPIMAVHASKFTPQRVAMQREDFCAKCHEIPGFVTPYADWQASAAAADGITCQGCHMARTRGERAYHGFDSFVIDPRAYDGDLSLESIELDFPGLSVTVHNRIRGHSVPAGGPTRILALEIAARDAAGLEIHTDRRTFAKYHSLVPILGFWPYAIIADTQLESGERRAIEFTLPDELAGRLRSIALTLRFYEVHDEHAGDIAQAYFVSAPFLEEVIVL